jgi:hypothetical protein
MFNYWWCCRIIFGGTRFEIRLSLLTRLYCFFFHWNKPFQVIPVPQSPLHSRLICITTAVEIASLNMLRLTPMAFQTCRILQLFFTKWATVSLETLRFSLLITLPISAHVINKCNSKMLVMGWGWEDMKKFCICDIENVCQMHWQHVLRRCLQTYHVMHLCYTQHIQRTWHNA